MGTSKLTSTKLILTKRIEELPCALDVFCKPQAFSREELIKAADNIVIPEAEITSLERAIIIFLVKEFFVLMYQSGLNNAQRAVWGALAKTHSVSIARADNISELKLEDSSTGTHILVRLYHSEVNEKELLDYIKKPISHCAALIVMASSFEAALLERLAAKIQGDLYGAEIHKGCSLDLIEFSEEKPGSYRFNLSRPLMPRPQSATVALC